ncbi:MAG TPA: response regulator transcription factor [Mobilitalea sp.]|nr:response regulator transcription factor [Mobilitalea sp.]
MPKIMIIEDDTQLRTQIKEVLLRYGYDVYAVEMFHNVEEQFVKVEPNLVLLDINLPYYDGNYYCRMFRKHSKIPIVIISARNSDIDQILSMELGADEYIVKPFNIQVLIAKINALIRRLYGDYSNSESSKDINVHGITLDSASFKVLYKKSAKELSKNDYKLLKMFLQNINQVLSREELLEEIWDESSFVDDNTLTVNVTRVKSKLADLGIYDVIKTKRGVGYLFDTSSLDDSN